MRMTSIGQSEVLNDIQSLVFIDNKEFANDQYEFTEEKYEVLERLFQQRMYPCDFNDSTGQLEVISDLHYFIGAILRGYMFVYDSVRNYSYRFPQLPCNRIIDS